MFPIVIVAVLLVSWESACNVVILCMAQYYEYVMIDIS
jgi:hypothetical protein